MAIVATNAQAATLPDPLGFKVEGDLQRADGHLRWLAATPNAPVSLRSLSVDPVPPDLFLLSTVSLCTIASMTALPPFHLQMRSIVAAAIDLWLVTARCRL